MAGQNPKPHTLEEVFNDFKGRRTGLLKALLLDVEQFFQQCDPKKENLCLFGRPNGTWEVKTPVEYIPPQLPEPVLGINFARDGTPRREWIASVAIHSDSWLISLAFYFGARSGFGRNERQRLCQMINKLPTIAEVVIGNPKQLEDEEEDNEEGGVCGECGDGYEEDEFWIMCDTCNIWFHGKCVKITPAKAETIQNYKCPSCCSNKKFKASR